MSNSKDYYKMRYAQAGYTDPTDVEPQSIFDARAMEYGASKDSKITTIKEDKKGTTETKTVTKDDGSKQTLTSFFPTIEPSLEERVAKNLSERNILPSLNSPVTHPAGYANANNTMTMPVTPFGEKSSSGEASLSYPSMLLVSEDLTRKRLANKKEADRISAMEKAMAPLSGKAVREARNIPWWATMKNNASNDYGRGLDHTAAYAKLAEEAESRAMDLKLEEIDKINNIPSYSQIVKGQVDDGVFDYSGTKLNPNNQPTAEESSLFDEDFVYKMGATDDGDMDSYVADDGSVSEDGQKKAWKEDTIKSEEKKINSVPAAVKSIETLQAELKALENDPKLRRRKYLDFLRQNGVLKRWRPDLFKALAGTAFRLMMGDSAGDAFTYSFGRLQEQKRLKLLVKAVVILNTLKMLKGLI